MPMMLTCSTSDPDAAPDQAEVVLLVRCPHRRLAQSDDITVVTSLRTCHLQRSVTKSCPRRCRSSRCRKRTFARFILARRPSTGRPGHGRVLPARAFWPTPPARRASPAAVFQFRECRSATSSAKSARMQQDPGLLIAARFRSARAARSSKACGRWRWRRPVRVQRGRARGWRGPRDPIVHLLLVDFRARCVPKLFDINHWLPALCHVPRHRSSRPSLSNPSPRGASGRSCCEPSTNNNNYLSSAMLFPSDPPGTQFSKRPWQTPAS